MQIFIIHCAKTKCHDQLDQRTGVGALRCYIAHSKSTGTMSIDKDILAQLYYSVKYKLWSHQKTLAIVENFYPVAPFCEPRTFTSRIWKLCYWQSSKQTNTIISGKCRLLSWHSSIFVEKVVVVVVVSVGEVAVRANKECKHNHSTFRANVLPTATLG